MLNFNDITFKQAVNSIGLEGNAIFPYKELLTSEITYLNHFLFYLNETDIQSLLHVYVDKHFELQPNEMRQAELQKLCGALQELREQQMIFLQQLYTPEPYRWLQILFDLNVLYQQYFRLARMMLVPAKVDVKFTEIQSIKMQAHLPQLGSLGAILIAPIQRLPRYPLLAKELLKAVDKQLGEMQYKNENLLTFKESLIVWLKGVSALVQLMDMTMLEESQAEPDSPYFQPSVNLHEQVAYEVTPPNKSSKKRCNNKPQW